MKTIFLFKKEFLEQYQGCVIIVSHDRYFMDKLVDHLFVLGARPMSHPSPVPIDAVPDVVVRFRSLREIEKRARIARKDRIDVLQRGRVA